MLDHVSSIVVVLAIAAGAERAARRRRKTPRTYCSPDRRPAPPSEDAASQIDQQVDGWVLIDSVVPPPAPPSSTRGLLLRIDDLDRVCALSESQKQKLRLAGQGDIKRFFDRVADSSGSSAGQTDPNQNIWQEIQPLQIELNTGLFGDESLFAKTIKRTLDREQTARARGMLTKRRRCATGRLPSGLWCMSTRRLGLTEKQRQQFIDLWSRCPSPAEIRAG